MTSLRRPIPAPRLLPLTMCAMGVLLISRSGEIVMTVANAETPAAHEDAAPAATPPPAPAAAPADAAKPAAPQPLAEKPAPPAEEAMTDSERALLLDLRNRREALDRRDSALAARETALGAVEARLAARFAELQQLQTKLEDLEKQRQARDEGNWQGLVKVYEAMKPRDAATIFDDLDMAVLLGVLDRMKEARAAPILAAMQPDRARQATVELQRLRAARNSIRPDAAAAKPSPAGG
jgi:flagellar motility protein MotE (MotC chaperone)